MVPNQDRARRTHSDGFHPGDCQLLAKWIALDAHPAISANENTEKCLIDPNSFLEIDINGALLRTNKNQELLKKVLLMFSNTHNNDSDKLIAYLSENNFSQIQALAHKLKGSAASIGANNVSSAASLLEKACKEKEYSACEQLISETNQKLTLALTELSTLSLPEIKKITAVLCVQDMQRKIDEFIILSQSDLAAAESVLLDIIGAAPTEPMAHTIIQHFDNFEIDAIYPLLDSFLLITQPNKTTDENRHTGY